MKNWVQRFRRVGAALLCMSVLAGCTITERLATEDHSNNPTADQTQHEVGYFGITYYTGEAINPIFSASKMNRTLIEALYEGLFYLDDHLALQSLLCEEWRGEGDEFTFTLKEGVTFWSGAPLTAYDVAYSLRAAKKNEGTLYHTRMADVTSVSVMDDRTVKVRLNAPNSDFPRMLDIPIFRAGTEGQTFSDGTGPYQPIAGENGNYHLEPYAGWHGGKVTAFDRIDLVSTVRADAAVYGFEMGDISLTRAERISSSPYHITGAVDLHQTPTTVMHYIGVNCKRAPYHLPNVRLAFSDALDRTALCANQLQTFADPAILPVNPQPEEYKPHMKSDLDSAEVMLKQAGIADSNNNGIVDWDDGAGRKFELTPVIIVNQENSFKVAAAQQFAASLTKIGVQATVQPLPFDQYEEALRTGKFDLYYAEVRMTPDYDMRSLIMTGGMLNYGAYTNWFTDQAVVGYRSAPWGDPTEMKKAFYDQFMTEMPIIPLAFIRDQVAIRSGLVVGFHPTPDRLFNGAENWSIG